MFLISWRPIKKTKTLYRLIIFADKEFVKVSLNQASLRNPAICILDSNLAFIAPNWAKPFHNQVLPNKVCVNKLLLLGGLLKPSVICLAES